MNAGLPIGLPLGFEQWAPVMQAVSLGALTLVQEDLPVVSAGLLASAGRIGWLAAFLGCFFGIWIGDALLYWLARGAGRPLLQSRWARRLVSPEAVARSERWFAERGTWVLVSSRCVPGARLPAYLAAGFLKAPFPRFLLVTGIAVALWTGAIFAFAQSLGPVLLKLAPRWTEAWVLLPLAAGVAAALRASLWLARRRSRQKLRAFFGRWTRWEFWPAWLFYPPVVVNYARLALRYRGWMIPTAANPGIFSGGIAGESKFATLADLHATSPEFTAPAWLVRGTSPAARLESLRSVCEQHRLECPFILKPDSGQRGTGVKLIRTFDQARAYLERTAVPVLVQRYAPGPREAGIFYYRFPHESRGRILAITDKIFPVITGDGTRTAEELIWDDPRARFAARQYLGRLGRRRTEVLAPGQTLRLVEAGNHAQGCIFRDGAHLWSVELEERIDLISRKLTGFFIGRYDLRYASPNDLRAGRNFQIVELNGAASEATHIYDERTPLFSAWRALFRQWELVFAIGAANQDRGAPLTPAADLWRAWRKTSARNAACPPAD